MKEKNVLDICRYIINACHEQGYSVSNLKLQKLLYFAQGYSLAIVDKPLFNEEFEAWDFGPVVPVAYRNYKIFGANCIPKIQYYYDINYDNDTFLDKIEYDKKYYNDIEQTIMDNIVKTFGRYSANELVKITHSQPPWINCYKKKTIIEKEEIKEYFCSVLRN